MTAEILITGAGGEIGQGLTNFLSSEGKVRVIGLDLQSPAEDKRGLFSAFYQGSILDKSLLDEIHAKHSISTIYHLAAILSTEGERNPLRTHQINVDGTINMLELARKQGEKSGKRVTFVFPSTIAVYGILDAAQKKNAGRVAEDQFLMPSTMYGVNKLYNEHLGRYYSTNFPIADGGSAGTRPDFRCLRLPGIVSSLTLPSGGTSDYFPEMIHAAAQGVAYECFVNPDSRLPFMVMPDAVKCMIDLSRADRNRLSRSVYNVGSFSISAEEIREEILKSFPRAQVSYKPNPRRVAIVDSWPGDVDDSAARRDWNWKPEFDRAASFSRYLVPQISARYAPSQSGKSCSSACAHQI